jgi:hypothetical protein
MAALRGNAGGNDNGTISVVSLFSTLRYFPLSAFSWLSSAAAISFGNCAA